MHLLQCYVDVNYFFKYLWTILWTSAYCWGFLLVNYILFTYFNECYHGCIHWTAGVDDADMLASHCQNVWADGLFTQRVKGMLACCICRTGLVVVLAGHYAAITSSIWMENICQSHHHDRLPEHVQDSWNRNIRLILCWTWLIRSNANVQSCTFETGSEFMSWVTGKLDQQDVLKEEWELMAYLNLRWKWTRLWNGWNI